MIQSSLSLLAFSFIATACGAIKQLDNNTDNGGTGISKTYRDATSTVTCNGSPSHANLIGTWKKTYVGDKGDTIELRYIVDNFNTRFERTCSYNGQQIQSAILVTSYITADQQLVITQANAHTEQFTVGGETVTCTISAKAIAMPFRLVGNCVAFIGDGTANYFTP